MKETGTERGIKSRGAKSYVLRLAGCKANNDLKSLRSLHLCGECVRKNAVTTETQRTRRLRRAEITTSLTSRKTSGQLSCSSRLRTGESRRRINGRNIPHAP